MPNANSPFLIDWPDEDEVWQVYYKRAHIGMLHKTIDPKTNYIKLYSQPRFYPGDPTNLSYTIAIEFVKDKAWLPDGKEMPVLSAVGLDGLRDLKEFYPNDGILKILPTFKQTADNNRVKFKK